MRSLQGWSFETGIITVSEWIIAVNVKTTELIIHVFVLGCGKLSVNAVWWPKLWIEISTEWSKLGSENDRKYFCKCGRNVFLIVDTIL